MSTYHSIQFLTTHGDIHLVIYGTSGSTTSEMISTVPLATSESVMSTAGIDAVSDL